MITKEEMWEVFRGYNKNDITIATIGSHSALQILNGAREEGFKNIVICKKGVEVTYERFGVADEIWVVDKYQDILDDSFQEKLKKKNAVMVPHGSLVAYIGIKNIEERLNIPILGNRGVLQWESNRDMERKWLERAGIRMPHETKEPRDVSELSIVKFPGAKGGRGYFLVSNPDEFKTKSTIMVKKGWITENDVKNATIQQYIAGVNMYLSYFYSPLKDEVELFGIDRRIESNIDGLTRIPAVDQDIAHIEPSYVVVGNIPIVARESLLSRVFEMGDSLVRVSKEIVNPGMLGAFCLETMVTQDLEFIAFEISARIVAGTNPFTNGSPYSYLLYGNNMSMGRRIALELKNAIKKGEAENLIT